jgi:hypothetical protein
MNLRKIISEELLKVINKNRQRMTEAYDDVSMDYIKSLPLLKSYTNYNDKIVINGNTYLNFRKNDDWYLWGDIKVFDNSDGTEIARSSYSKQYETSRLTPSIDVRSDKRRSGIASNIYNWIEKLVGEKLYPDIPHTKSAEALWNNPKRTFGYDKNITESNLIAYHGTNHKFDSFRLDKTTDGTFWFTDSIDSIKNGTHGGVGSKYIMKRKITINNPAGWNEYEKYSIGELINKGYDGVILPEDDKIDYIVFNPNQIQNV